ncbi:hypothetical protein B0H11DRAFT_2244367 [Mycena galericulata]|nr:hypothetical protein B0H11DRAFT_2244367 [Mycena galericulata]
MLPVTNTYGAWLASGEIDVVESRGNGAAMAAHAASPARAVCPAARGLAATPPPPSPAPIPPTPVVSPMRPDPAVSPNPAKINDEVTQTLERQA